MGNLVIGVIFILLGIILDIVGIKSSPKSKKLTSSGMKFFIAYSIKNSWGWIFTVSGLISLSKYCFGLDTITWKNGLFLFVAIISISYTIHKIISLLLNKKTKI